MMSGRRETLHLWVGGLCHVECMYSWHTLTIPLRLQPMQEHNWPDLCHEVADKCCKMICPLVHRRVLGWQVGEPPGGKKTKAWDHSSVFFFPPMPILGIWISPPVSGNYSSIWLKRCFFQCQSLGYLRKEYSNASVVGKSSSIACELQETNNRWVCLMNLNNWLSLCLQVLHVSLIHGTLNHQNQLVKQTVWQQLPC